MRGRGKPPPPSSASTARATPTSARARSAKRRSRTRSSPPTTCARRRRSGSASGLIDLYRRAQQRRRGELRAPGDRTGGLAPVEAARHPACERRQASPVQLAPPIGGQHQAQRDAVALDEIALGHGIDAAILGAVEEELDFVALDHLETVLDQQAPRGLVELDQPPVLHRILEPRVAVVPAFEAVLLRGRQPQAAAGARLVQPEEVAALLRLVAAIDAQRVVRGGAAEV